MAEKELVDEFMRSHRQLGFSKVRIQPFFPDCVAIKDGKEVAIEFEVDSNGLVSHLVAKRFEPIIDFLVFETDRAIYIIRHERKYCWQCELANHHKHECPVGHVEVFGVFQKSKYYFEKQGCAIFVYYKRLPIDYCICWKHGAKNRAKFDPRLKGVTFIELE